MPGVPHFRGPLALSGILGLLVLTGCGRDASGGTAEAKPTRNPAMAPLDYLSAQGQGKRRSENVVAVAPKAAPTRPQPVQTSISLEVNERAKPAREDDDLQIPAFLRRQAN